MLGIKLRVLHMLGKLCVTELCPYPIYVIVQVVLGIEGSSLYRMILYRERKQIKSAGKNDTNYGSYIPRNRKATVKTI